MLYVIGLLLLFNLIDLPLVVTIDSNSEVSLDKADYQYDIKIYEHYTIWGCGENAVQLYRALHMMSGELYLAKHDAKEGTKSDHGYTAFFKSDIYKDFISEMLNVMSYGWPAGIHPPQAPVHGLGSTNPVANTPPHMPSPQLICATELTSTIFGIPFDVSAYCAEYPEQYAFVIKLSPYLIVCPSFWSTRVSPDNRYARCPKVKDNRFQGINYHRWNGIMRSEGEDRLTCLRRYALLHEIVVYYLQHVSLTADTEPNETLDWNECVALAPDVSWRNSENWVLYVASVEFRCTEFPEYRAPENTMPPMINLTILSQ